MGKDIKLKTVVPIVNDGYISKIDNVVENIDDITLEVKVSKYKVFELKDIIFTILHLDDNTGSICALLVGNRNDEGLKKIISNIGINANYRVRGSILFFDEGVYEDLNDMLGNKINIKDYFVGNKLLSIVGIQNLNNNYRDYEKIELFGVDINTLYDFDLNDAYNFINDNTDYLKNISFEEVKEIKFSCYKDIVILLKNGVLIVNGEEKLDNIKTLGIDCGMYIFSISNDNIITCLTGNWKTTQFINDNNYKYKKIIIVGCGIAALTYENTIRYFGMVLDGVIDYNNFYDVDDIGYIEEENSIVVIRKDKVISLFDNEDYTTNYNILLSGCGEDFIIIDSN